MSFTSSASRALAGMIFTTTLLTPLASYSDTLMDTLDRGYLRCGVNPELAGFSRQNSLGEFSGFDVDFCRAVSAAIFNDPDRVDYVPVNSTERFTSLLGNRYDLLSRNTTWTLDRDVNYGEYAGVSFYDGQGFMVAKQTGIRSALELDNQKICVLDGTTSQLNAFDFFSESKMRYRPVLFEASVDASQGYIEGECSAITGDRSALASQRASFEVPEAHIVLPEVISKEPLGPVVRHGDDRWEGIVRWTLACLINAEELRVTKDRVLDLTTENSPPAIRRLLGVEGDAGEKLGLNNNWCASVIATVGNYKEIYNQHIGPDTPIALDRGVNSLWTNGGLLYAAPIR